MYRVYLVKETNYGGVSFHSNSNNRVDTKDFNNFGHDNDYDDAEIIFVKSFTLVSIFVQILNLNLKMHKLQHFKTQICNF